MSTDQPVAKKPIEGQIDPKKPVVGDKAPAEKSAAAAARDSWQAELAKAQLPSGVKVTLAHLGPPAVAERLANPLKLSSASTEAATAKPGRVEPAVKVEAAAKTPSAEAKPKVEAPVAKPKPAPPESVTMSALHWVENKASAAYTAVKNTDVAAVVQSVADHPTELTTAGLYKSAYDSVMSNDKKGLLALGGVVVGGMVLHKFGGAALSKAFKVGSEAEAGESGVASEILNAGSEPKLGTGLAKPIARTVTTEAGTGMESVSAKLNAAKGTAAFEFGPTKFTATEGLVTPRTTLRAASVPVLDGPLARTGNANISRALQFQVGEPIVPKIPVGLKPAVEPGLKGALDVTSGRIPSFTEFKVEGQRFAPPKPAGEIGRLHGTGESPVVAGRVVEPIKAVEPTHVVEPHRVIEPTRAVEPTHVPQPSRLVEPKRVVEPGPRPGSHDSSIAHPAPVHIDALESRPGALESPSLLGAKIDAKKVDVPKVGEPTVGEHLQPGANADSHVPLTERVQRQTVTAEIGPTSLSHETVTQPVIAERVAGPVEPSHVVQKVEASQTLGSSVHEPVARPIEGRSPTAKLAEPGTGKVRPASKEPVSIESNTPGPSSAHPQESHSQAEFAPPPSPGKGVDLTKRLNLTPETPTNLGRVATPEVVVTEQPLAAKRLVESGPPPRILGERPATQSSTANALAEGEGTLLKPKVGAGAAPEDIPKFEGLTGAETRSGRATTSEPVQSRFDPQTVQPHSVVESRIGTESQPVVSTIGAEPRPVIEPRVGQEAGSLAQPRTTGESQSAFARQSKIGPEAADASIPSKGITAPTPVNAADLVARYTTEARTAVQRVSSELRTLQQFPGVTEKTAQGARTLELNLQKMTAVGAEDMSAAARAQSMADIEKGYKALKAEVKDIPVAQKALTGIDDGVTQLRSANDNIVRAASQDAKRAVAADLRSSLQDVTTVDRETAQSINKSLDRIAAPEVTAVEKRAAISELSTSIEKLEPVTSPAQYKALQQQVAELRSTNAAAEVITANENVETAARQVGELARSARTAIGPEAGTAGSALERLEQSSATLSTSRTATTLERQTILNSMESDVRLLNETPAVVAHLPQLEREVAALRTSENSLNLVKNEESFAQSSPKFSQVIEETLARPGVSVAQKVELETLRASATRLEPSTFNSLNAEQQARALSDVETQVTRTERELGEAGKLREAFSGVKASATDLIQARNAVAVDEMAVTKAKPAFESAKLSEADVTANAPHLSNVVKTEPPLTQSLEPVTEGSPVAVGRETASSAREGELLAAEKPLTTSFDASVVGERAGINERTSGVTGGAATERVIADGAAVERPITVETRGVKGELDPNASFRENASAETVRPTVVEGAETKVRGRVSESVVSEPTATNPAQSVSRTAAEERELVNGRPLDATNARPGAQLSSEAAPEGRLNEAVRPTEVTGESNTTLRRAEVVKDATVKVETSTTALSRSVDTASEINRVRGLGGDVELAEKNLTAMRKELDEAVAAKREPDLTLLRAKAAELPSEAGGALSTRIDGVNQARTTRDELSALDKAHKLLDSNVQLLTAQLGQLNVPGASATIAELKSGALSLAEAKDRIATLRFMAEHLAVLAPSLPADFAQRLGGTLEQLKIADATANSALVDVINTQVARAGDLAETKESLKILTAVVPEGSETAQLIKTASDHLSQVEVAQARAQADFEATRTVFLNPSIEQQMSPVSGLVSATRRLFSLQDQAAAISEALSPRSFGAVQASLLLAGGSFAFTSGASAQGTISAQRDAADVRNADRSATFSLSSPGDNVAETSKVSNQAAFAPKADVALSPLVQAVMAQNALRNNVTLAHNWEQQNTARGFYAQAFSPDKPQDAPIQTFFAPIRKVGLTTSTAPTDVKPRLVYPGFAQRQLNEMAAARRRGGLLSVFADTSTGARSFGAGLTGANTAAQTASSRIPAGLSRLLNREIISNGLDANGETSNAPHSPVATQEPASNLSLAAVDPGNNVNQSTVAASSATPTLTPDRAKSLAV